MCIPGLDPATMMMIASVASTAAGTAKQISGQQQAINASADAQQAENIRQQQFRKNQERVTNQSLILGQRRNVRDEDIARGERRFQQQDEKAKSRSPALKQALPGQAKTSRAVASSGARDAQARSGGDKQIADAFARMGGFRRADVNNQGTLLDAFSKLQQEGSFARGSVGVLPAELRAAANQGAGDRSLGDILNGLGMVLGVGSGLAGLGGGPSVVTGVGAGPTPLAGPIQPFNQFGINPSQIQFTPGAF